MSCESIYKTNQETIDKGIKTLEMLSEQRDKLDKINKETIEIDSNLSYAQYILNKMTSIIYNLKSKFYIKEDKSEENDSINDDNIKNDNIKNDNLPIKNFSSLLAPLGL